MIRRSKTDQEGQGAEVAIPVATACARSRRCRRGWPRPRYSSGRCPHGAAPWRTNQRRDREALRPRAHRARSGLLRRPQPGQRGFLTSAAKSGSSAKVSRHKGLDTLRAPGHSFCLFCGQDRSKRDNQGASDHGVGQHSAQIAVVARLVAPPERHRPAGAQRGRVVKHYAERAGVDAHSFAGHSLRSGSAAQVGGYAARLCPARRSVQGARGRGVSVTRRQYAQR